VKKIPKRASSCKTIPTVPFVHGKVYVNGTFVSWNYGSPANIKNKLDTFINTKAMFGESCTLHDK
jgi:hypothetical protein